MKMEETAFDEELGNKKLKLQVEEDRISALPASIIHHILSFLDSTKEAIQTCVLSKRWKNQWTGVPVLAFDLYGKSYEYSSRFIDNTLDRYGCSKILKFYIRIGGYIVDKYPYFEEKISFAIGKHVKDLILEFIDCRGQFMLPESVFNHSSLVRLETDSFTLKPNTKVSWGHLKELDLRNCKLPDNVIDNILSGSPVLESLEIDGCDGIDQLVIVSQFMKKLDLVGDHISVLEISCPNLEELYLVGFLGNRLTELTNLSCLNRATLDFWVDVEEFDVSLSLPKKILQQLQHAKELIIGNVALKVFSLLDVQPGLSPSLLNNKCLTLECPEVDVNAAGIAYALQCSHMLEKLVMNKVFPWIADDLDFENVEDKYWSSNKTVFNCLESHLKFVEIINFSKSDADHKHVINFIEFILKKARVLEKLVVLFEIGDEGFMLQVSLKVLSFPRCSQHATVEFSNYEPHF